MPTKLAQARTFQTSVDVPAATRGKVNAILNQHLADSFDLLSQVKQAHWNVKGPDFWQLRKLFDEVAERAEEWVDQLAERITALGGYAHGTIRMATASSKHASRVSDRHHREHGLRPHGRWPPRHVHQLGSRASAAPLAFVRPRLSLMRVRRLGGPRGRYRQFAADVRQSRRGSTAPRPSGLSGARGEPGHQGA